MSDALRNRYQCFFQIAWELEGADRERLAIAWNAWQQQLAIVNERLEKHLANNDETTQTEPAAGSLATTAEFFATGAPLPMSELSMIPSRSSSTGGQDDVNSNSRRNRFRILRPHAKGGL